jgi:hypothetical protein
MGSHTEKVYGIGDKQSGDTKMFDVQTILAAVLNMSRRSTHLTDEAFFW